MSPRHLKKDLTAKFRSGQREQLVSTNDQGTTNSASIDSLLDAASSLTALACEPQRQRLAGQQATSPDPSESAGAKTSNSRSDDKGQLVTTAAIQAAEKTAVSSDQPRKRRQTDDREGSWNQRASKRINALDRPAALVHKQSPGEMPANPSSGPAKTPSDNHGLTAKEKMPIAPKQRYIPAHKKSSCALTFPEKLLAMLDYADKMKAEMAANGADPETFCLSWNPDGESFLVRDPVTCTQTVIPLFFKKAKFASITRKLYRWGFHQVERRDADGPPLPPDAMIFANDHFKRDARHEIVYMRSNTTPSYKRKSPRDDESEDDEKNNLSVVNFQLNEQCGNAFPRAADGTDNSGRARYDGNSITSSEAASNERSHHAKTSTYASFSAQDRDQSINPAESLHMWPQQLQHQNQRQRQIQAILTACNGDLSRVDPNVLQILLSQANIGRCDGSVATLLGANAKPNPSPNLQQLFPYLSNHGVNLGHQRHQLQNLKQQNQQQLLQPIGLTTSGITPLNRPHQGSHSLPQQGAVEGGTITPFLLQTFMNRNPSTVSSNSNNIMAGMQARENTPQINTGVNFHLQNASISHITNRLLPSPQDQQQASPLLHQYQHRQLPHLPQDEMNAQQPLNTTLAPFSSYQPGSRLPGPLSSQGLSDITQLQNLTNSQKEQLIQLLRNAAETLENGRGQNGQL